jgi:hypothetical protein
MAKAKSNTDPTQSQVSAVFVFMAPPITFLNLWVCNSKRVN